MNSDERQQIVHALGRIPAREWDGFLRTEQGEPLRLRLEAVRGTLRAAGALSGGTVPKPIEETVDLLGYGLLSNDRLGRWLRQKTLERLAPTQWAKLADLYRELAGNSGEDFHGNMAQAGRGSEVLASYWRRGSRWAAEFCRASGFPAFLGQPLGRHLPTDEDVVPAEPLPELHGFQVPVYKKLRRLLSSERGATALMSLPTGAGKTRVTLEAICDHLAEGRGSRRRNLVLWISLSDELQLQAWECIRHVWQVPPQREGRPIRRPAPLRIVRAWGGRDPDDIELTDEPTFLVAGIDQLASWARRRPDFFEAFPVGRLACVVVDEAHSLITREYAEVLVALGCRQKREWAVPSHGPIVIGLSATPWRSRDDQSRQLRGYFNTNLIRPQQLEPRPVARLQRMGILSRVRATTLRLPEAPEMTRSQRARAEQFGEVPSDYLETLGYEPARNAAILERLSRLPKRGRSIVFTCAVSHAEIMAMTLDRYFGKDCAAAVSAHTARAERASVIERFREGDGVRFLCNVGVLTMGFDAPRTDSVCVTRPTTSATLYEQMVGRGLRGPRNGGTKHCTVIDAQDESLPFDVQSYARVLALWDGVVADHLH